MGIAQRNMVNQVRQYLQPTVQQSRRRLPHATTFQATYSPIYEAHLHHCPWILKDRSNLLYEHLHEKAGQRQEQGLCWSVIVPVAISKHKTVRSWAKRRVKTAFGEALALSGYHENGITLARAEGATEFDLKGSVRFMIHSNALTASKELIDQEVLKLVNFLSTQFVRRPREGASVIRKQAS